MALLSEDEKLWLQHFSSEDLARTLVREYLYQHNMFKTLNCFEIEDQENSKKINRSTVIKMLCINNLVVNNKKLQKQKQAKSLLLLLVQYLRGKFQERIKRQDYSDHGPLSHKNQKQFSMNGDQLTRKELLQGNIIKENLVNMKRKETDIKIATQESFSNQKDFIGQKDDLNFVKKSSNEIKQEKKNMNLRPSTANPALNFKKQEKQKLQGIYGKINVQNEETKPVKNIEKDDKIDNKKIEEASYGNSAISRNNKFQNSGRNTKQLQQQKKNQPQQQKIQNQNNDQKQTVQNEILSQNSRRGGNKLVRKGQESIKQQNAIETLENKEFKIQTLPQAQPIKFLKIEQINQQQPKPQSKMSLSPNIQQQPPSTTVRQIKLKKKAKNNDQEPKISSKFKFDENFVDEPLYGKKQKYQYEKFSFLNMVIKEQLKPKDSNIVLSSKINYKQKPSSQVSGGNPYAQGMMKKKNEKPLSTTKGQALKKIVFGQASPYLPKAWHQGFILSPFADTFYGLKQIQGGPCGIIAAVQCYFLKHLLYLSKTSTIDDLKNELIRQICLVAALADILWKVKGNNQKVILAIPSNRNFSGPKLQISNLIEVEIDATSFQSFYQVFWSYKSSFIGQVNHGVTAIIYSIVMTKGVDKIYNEVDMKDNPLIGNHGHCTQELVNLFITGQASSNCFDGKKQLEDNFTLHGISRKSEFGFLTVYETLGYLEVGKNLKNPLFPIWIISKEFHYHVIFGNHYLIGQNNDCEKFDLVYFDGLYTCDKYIRLTFDQVEKDEFGMIKDTGDIDKLPLIEQVLLKKWGKRKTDWNGSTKIL